MLNDQTHFFSLVLAGLENVYEPLQLIPGIGGVHHQPKVFSCTKVHIERDQPQTRLNLHCVESSISVITTTGHLNDSKSNENRHFQALGHLLQLKVLYTLTGQWRQSWVDYLCDIMSQIDRYMLCVIYTRFWLYHTNIPPEIKTPQTRKTFFQCPILVSLCKM